MSQGAYVCSLGVNISTYPDCDVNCRLSVLPENQNRGFLNIHTQNQLSNHSERLSTACWSSVANMVGSALATYSDVSSANRLVKEAWSCTDNEAISFM